LEGRLVLELLARRGVAYDADANRLTDISASVTEIGTWTFADSLASGLPVNTALRSGSVGEGSLQPAITARTAKKLRQAFLIQRNSQTPVTALVIAGATIAKRQ
jgi:predicted metal-dependent phosphotriesterase family hydrolase